MPKTFFLGELEHLTLLAVLQLGDEAYALSVRRHLETVVGRAPARGALYRTLERLHQKGHLEWRVEAGGPARGGHPRRRFSVTAKGLSALRASRRTLRQLWRGFETVLE